MTNKVMIRQPNIDDESAFLAMTHESRDYHHPWVSAPQTHDAFVAYLERTQQPTHQSYLVLNEARDLVGVYNISEIVRGAFQSAYLGFYGSVQHAGKGLMAEGLKLVLHEMFTSLKLHRIEANIQPNNIRSLNLIKKTGFKKEGFSPRYLNINNQWCDHERWALTVEDWKVKPSYNSTTVRLMNPEDITAASAAFSSIGWNKPPALFQGYHAEQEKGERFVWVAYQDENFLGYVTLKLHSLYQPFKARNIPEINDLNVLPAYRSKGIGTLLLEAAEKQALHCSDTVGIGVGLYPDYGVAQRIYVKRGYIPDGFGITYQYQSVIPGESYAADDDLILWFTKKLK